MWTFFFSEPPGDKASSPLDLFFFFFFFSEPPGSLFRFFVGGAELTTPGGAEPSRGSLVELGKKRARTSRGCTFPL